MTPRVLARGLGFTEGPVFTQDGRIVVVSIDQGRADRITPAGAEILVGREDRGGGRCSWSA